MKLVSKLAFNQIKINRNRSVMTLIGIILSTAMLTAVCGFVSSAKQVVYDALGMDSNAPMHLVLIVLGAILGAIIMTASIVVVSNAFRVSAGERTKQFGILKSVGATKKQIASSVLYEGIFLSIIGIPLGILLGLLIDVIGLWIITNLINTLSEGGTLNLNNDKLLSIPFSAPPLMFFVTILSSFGTVLISAWLPARKAAKIPAIDAIRSAGDIKVSKNNYKTSKIIQAIFGFEGTLAAKSLKRSRRSFRATVLALTISIVLLIVASGFGGLMQRSTEIVFSYIDADVLVEWSSDKFITYDENGRVDKVERVLMSREVIENITENLQKYNDTEVFGYGGNFGNQTEYPAGNIIDAALITTTRIKYEELCRVAGVPIGSAILINTQFQSTDGKRGEFTPFDFSKIKGKTFAFTSLGSQPINITITGQLTGEDIPNGINMRLNGMQIIVPDCEVNSYSWFINTNDIKNFLPYSEKILNETAPKGIENIEVYQESLDISAIIKQMRDLVNTIMLFVYGFVGMLTLIAITSIISTINTNIRSRAKEFAILESIGMTKLGIKKMLNLESILCSIRSLIYGIPLGLLSSYGMYKGMGFSVTLPFEFPSLLILICIVGIFIITWITMRYSANKLKSKNIIEAIRNCP